MTASSEDAVSTVTTAQEIWTHDLLHRVLHVYGASRRPKVIVLIGLSAIP
ncbi:MAG TPA: hypothetical protein VEQ67_10585 [Mycobacterium sp.]|nr:hypothetical protein [Mycobacterium sp.]